jgi:hypothetical protein
VADTVQAIGTPEEKSLKIKDIEPLLKWGAVAYGGGFLTVMLHTHRLGLPVMQLIEPIYIWIGIPLATTLYFFEPLIAAYQRRRALLRQEMNEIKLSLNDLKAIKTPQEAAQESIKASTEMIDMLMTVFTGFVVVAPLGAAVMLIMKKILMPYLQKMLNESIETSGLGELRADLVNFSRFLNFANRTVMAFFQFGLRLLPLVLILLALAFYTFVVYPAIPQSLGGGKPSQARLIIDVKKIPLDGVSLRDLFPQSEPGKAIAESPKTTADKPESQITCRVALQYETEHAYYIRRGHGPIVVIDHDAVNGIIFVPSETSAQQGCT